MRGYSGVATQNYYYGCGDGHTHNLILIDWYEYLNCLKRFIGGFGINFCFKIM